jgi:hypothetical protein
VVELNSNKGTTCAIKGREILEKGLKKDLKESDVGLARKNFR